MSKNRNETRKIELVETDNIARSLDRLNNNGLGEYRWRRALYHALCMTGTGGYAQRKAIREALELPGSRKTTFGPFENRLARRIGRYERNNSRTPKKWEIIQWDTKNDPLATMAKGRYVFHKGQSDRRAFKNLLALGLIEHSRNGHCWLTDAGKKKLRLKS